MPVSVQCVITYLIVIELKLAKDIKKGKRLYAHFLFFCVKLNLISCWY